MGVVIVGPSGAGKSTLWRMLRAALIKTGKVVSMMQLCHLSIFSIMCMCVKKKKIHSDLVYTVKFEHKNVFFFQVRQYIMNPKAMPRQQLLGQIDMDTREWTDGVLTNSARNVVREPQGNKS